ncbi:MAG: cupin domain-containing protein [Fibrobacteres bacterium]|nr:cupin domain-containing protein [Fibrobacterota bacterium]
MIRKKTEMLSEIREKMRGGTGSVKITHMIKPEEFKAPVRLCSRLTIEAGSGIGLHEHATEDEVYVVVKGSGLLDEGNGKVKVETGDAILTGNGARHSIENPGPETLELYAFIATYQ